jgi:DNA invertase Pin-like site-specific DNA recombinase
MDEQQIKQARQLHDSGVTWSVIAALFKASQETLRKQIKHYEKTNSEIHSTS